MYAGHLGIALALRADRGAPPLWLLAVAAQGPDWIEFTLEATGHRWVDPSRSPHALPSLALGAVVAAVVAVIAVIAARGRGTAAWRAAAVAAIAYLSHWPADYVTGMKPTWPGGPLVGLDFYARPALDLLIETVVVTAGWWAWRRSLRPLSATGRALAVALLATLLALQLAGDLAMSQMRHSFG